MHSVDWFIHLIRRLMSSPPAALGNNKAKLLRHFRRKPDVRLPLVTDIVNGQAQPTPSLSPLEVVAIFSLQWDKSIDDLVQEMASFCSQSWPKHFADEFFSLLEQTIREFYVKGFGIEANNLLKFAEASARNQGAQEWEAKFHEQIDVKGGIRCPQIIGLKRVLSAF